VTVPFYSGLVSMLMFPFPLTCNSNVIIKISKANYNPGTALVESLNSDTNVWDEALSHTNSPFDLQKSQGSLPILVLLWWRSETCRLRHVCPTKPRALETTSVSRLFVRSPPLCFRKDQYLFITPFFHYPCPESPSLQPSSKVSAAEPL
jgi:hypothetical protein